MTYAYNINKDLVFIDNVPNGKNCNCTCPECGETLIARNEGKKNEHHFAHISRTEYEHGFQTMVHLSAKEIFIEAKYIPIPVLFYGNSYFKNSPVSKAIEELDFGDFKPDIVLDYDDILFSDERKAILTSKPVTTIEYDLSKIDRHITKENLNNVLSIQIFAKNIITSVVTL